MELQTKQTWGSLALLKKGEAVWNTAWQPSTAESKEPSSRRFAFTSCSLSLAPSRLTKWSTFLGSSAHHKSSNLKLS